MSVKLTPVTVQIVLVPNLARTSSTEHIKIEKEKNKQIIKKQVMFPSVRVSPSVFTRVFESHSNWWRKLSLRLDDGSGNDLSRGQIGNCLQSLVFGNLVLNKKKKMKKNLKRKIKGKKCIKVRFQQAAKLPSTSISSRERQQKCAVENREQTLTMA